MKTREFIVFLFLGCFLFPSLAYGDDIPTHGKWGDEDYRSLTALPPTLSIEGDLLSVQFRDALDDLTIQILDEQGRVVYEGCFSCSAGEIQHISLENETAGLYQVSLTHKLGWLVGDFYLE